MRVLRLRAAVLLLSAPEATPSDVARTVGYGSLDAMGRAFRDAHLPAPSVVQQAVRFRES
jgi:AraC-like DNA-binding protein